MQSGCNYSDPFVRGLCWDAASHVLSALDLHLPPGNKVEGQIFGSAVVSFSACDLADIERCGVPQVMTLLLGCVVQRSTLICHWKAQ